MFREGDKREQGQSWEQSGKEAPRRALPGGPAAETPRAHSEAVASGLACGNGIPHDTAQAKK